MINSTGGEVPFMGNPVVKEKFHYILGKTEYKRRKALYGENLGFDPFTVEVHLYKQFHLKEPRLPRKLKKKLNARYR